MSDELEEPERKRSPFTRLQAIVVLAVVIVFATSGVVGVNEFRRQSRKSDCKNCLKQLGIYFALYESRFKAYPTPGPETWFGLLWRTGIATDGNVFRCPVVGRGGTGTHYRGLRESGIYSAVAGASYSWTTSLGITDAAPPDLPMACDDDHDGAPNHGRGDDRNVLFFQGRVDVFAIGSPTEQSTFEYFLNPTTWAAPAGRE